MEGRIVYFEEGGAQNTQATLDLVSERLGSKDIKKIILASTTGDTARRAMEFFRDQEVTLVVVPHQFDFHRDKNAFPPDILRSFCQGVKVCFEIVYMAADAGLVAGGEKVMAIAGTGRGSDTALVMQAASTQHSRRLKVHEILCKPLNPLSLDELQERMARKET